MMSREDLFDLCSSERMKYVYTEAWVKVVKSDSGYKIEEIDWTLTKLGYYDEKDLKDEIMEIEVPDLEEEDGFYVLKCLFSVEYDSDDYRSWTYLTPEIYKFDLQITLDQAEEQQKEWDDLTSGKFPDDLLLPFKEEM
jgi:hypothetical protein